MNNTFPPSEFSRFASSHDLSLIVNFHNEVERSFRSEIEWIDQKLAKDNQLSSADRTRLKARKNTYLNTFEPYLRINTFLMMFSQLEEWLYHAWKRHAPDTVLDEAKGGVARFKPVLGKIGVDLSGPGAWMFLKDCQDIRSCLLHANGRVSLFRKPERITNLVARYSDEIRIDSDRLVIGGAFLSNFQDAVERLARSVSRGYE